MKNYCDANRMCTAVYEQQKECGYYSQYEGCRVILCGYRGNPYNTSVKPKPCYNGKAHKAAREAVENAET